MPSIALIVPCYNEEARLPVRDLSAFLESHPDASLCFVDDGSTDGTRATLERVRAQHPSQVQVLIQSTNVGKAAAVRAGVLHCASLNAAPILGYCDADLATPLTEIDRLHDVLRTTPNCRLVMGSRVKRLGAEIDRQTARHMMGRVFATCARGVLGFSVYDSQCGAKLFHADLADTLFREPFLTRWLFDLEILARLRNTLGGTTVGEVAVEVPLERWRDVRGSKLRARDLLAVPIELVKLGAHYKRRS